ncbi:MAG: PKD domain-containing protein, partial [Flavitalea sp.]
MENSTYVNRRLLHVLFFVLLGLSSQAQHVAKSLTAGNGSLIGFYEYKPTDYTSTGEKYPLIIFLHGVSERGNGTTDLGKVLAQGIPRYINKGHKMTFTWNGKKETFLVLSPQLSLSYGNWQQFYTEEMLKYAKANLNIDTNRIYLTGISLGGGGVWNYASASEANSRKFAAIAPICGTCSMTNGCNVARSNVPIWTEHAANDPTVSVNCTINANKGINGCNAAVKPIEFIPPTGGHVIWNRSYDTAYVYHQPLIYEWFLGQDKSLPINKLPIAKASAPLEVNITTGTFTLSATGSTDADGSIVRYGWRQISGPVTTSVLSNANVSTTVNGLSAIGTYTYELTVIDNRATWHKDTISVKGVTGTVIVPNKAPTANAGNDQTITLPTNSVSLNGGASTDADGT